MIDIVAEFGQSHGGRLSTAMVQAATAKDAGCSYVKWQTFAPERLVSRTAGRYWSEHLGGAASQYQTFVDNGMLKPYDWKTLGDYCRTLGVGFMSSPFDLEAVDLLVDAGVDAFKLASGAITHRQLLQKVAATGKKVFLSTGAADEHEIEQALDWLCPSTDVTLLACTLAYPCPDGHANLARIQALDYFGWPVGYSDHTLRTDTALAAVCAGASVLEKHCTLDEEGSVPDDKMALNPVRLRQYVEYAQLGERMRGGQYVGVEPSEVEMSARAGARRSLHAAVDIPAGKTLQVDDFVCLRPGGPFAPADVDVLVGRTAARGISAGDQIRHEDVT